MTSYSTQYVMSKSTNESRTVDKALRWVGDLDHPFYSDERNRFVWYEASAIAFQLLFLGSYFMAGTLLLVVGAPAMPYVLAMFAPAMITALVFQTYLKRNLAEYWPTRNDLTRRRGQLGIAAGVVLLAGLIRASVDLQSNNSVDGSFAGGLVGGVIAGSVFAIAVLVYKSRQQTSAEELDDF